MGADADQDKKNHAGAGACAGEPAGAGRADSVATGAAARVGGRCAGSPAPRDPFIRAENEDDDGYDPYSDRRPEPEPLFERDPWG